MTIFILSDPKARDGPNTWKHLFCKILDKLDGNYIVIEDIDLTTINFGIDNVIVINNYFSLDLFSKGKIESISKFNKLYFVIHSPLSPSNGILLRFSEYMSGFLCISEQIYEKVKNIYPNKETYLLQNYVITKHITRNVIKNNIAFVGRLSPEKNLPILFYAIKAINNVRFSIDIFGTATNKEYSDYLRDLVIDLRLNDIVKFRGSKDRHEDLFGTCQYLILPSISEGSSYSILEALSYKIPIISSNVGNAKNIIGTNGIVFDWIGLKKYDETLYVNSYENLLEEIGYIGGIVKCNGKFKKQLVPPIGFGISEELFKKNVNILKDAIIQSLNKNILVEDDNDYEEKYINEINRFVLFNKQNAINYEMDYELISVIIPVFNRRDKILEAINSITSQTYPNLEIIVVDDGSTDNIQDIIPDNIKFIRSEINVGCWNARNLGLRHASGKYITFHDSDDISNNDRLLTQYKLLKLNNLKIIGTNLIRTHIKSFAQYSDIQNRIMFDKTNKNINHHVQCCRKFIGFPTLLYKRELFDEDNIGRFNKMIKGTDAEWLIRFFKKYEKKDFINGYKLHEHITNNTIGYTYLFLNDVLYYSSEMDEFNISNLN